MPSAKPMAGRRPRGQTEARSGQYTNGGNWRERALRLSLRNPRIWYGDLPEEETPDLVNPAGGPR